MSMLSKKWSSTLVVVLLILNLLFLFLIKYKNQNLSISEFRIQVIGNILNLFFIIILIIGILVYSTRRSIKYNGKMLIWFAITISLLLLIAYICTIIPISRSNLYIFYHPLNRIISGAVFFIYQYTLIFFITFIWLKVFETENLFLTSLVDSVIILIGLLIFAFLFSFLKKIDLEYPKLNSNGKNVAVVLGAAVWSHNIPSPSLQSRIEKAIELYNKGIVNQIQLTGSNAPGELSEARVAFNYLLRKGIDPVNIWIEEKTTSTSEQIHFIRDELIKKKRINNIILVSAPYHLARAEEICKFYNIKTYLVASDIFMSKEGKIYNSGRESIALLAFWLFAI